MEKELFVAPEELGAFFKDALCDLNNVFVFSTDVVKNSWAEWCVSHHDESGSFVQDIIVFVVTEKYFLQSTQMYCWYPRAFPFL